jgi:hypothetical protein
MNSFPAKAGIQCINGAGVWKVKNTVLSREKRPDARIKKRA